MHQLRGPLSWLKMSKHAFESLTWPWKVGGGVVRSMQLSNVSSWDGLRSNHHMLLYTFINSVILYNMKYFVSFAFSSIYSIIFAISTITAFPSDLLWAILPKPFFKCSLILASLSTVKYTAVTLQNYKWVFFPAHFIRQHKISFIELLTKKLVRLA